MYSKEYERAKEAYLKWYAKATKMLSMDISE